MRLRALKGWFRWMTRQNLLLHNPASELELPKLGSTLPKHVLNSQEVEQLLALADPATPQGLRDRALLETFYATAMRRLEIANLKLYNIDADRGVVMVRQGKGKKDRVIPIGERALAWIAKYLGDARPALQAGRDDGTVFLTDLGEPFERAQLTHLVRHYLEKSKLGKTGGCHLFRHTAATLMLENGADVRVIQEMLGHADLSTTELYTRVAINLLKQVYMTTHPAARLERKAAAEDIFAALDAEAKEEGEDA
jgi:integrase/recombinase XerD